MLNNVGATDRIIRVILAGILLYLGLAVYGGSILGILITITAVVALLSGLVGSCLLYSLLGINTSNHQS